MLDFFFYFSLRVSHYCVNLWNSLPQNVVEAKTLCDFKKKLHVAFETNAIKGYGERGDQDIEVDDQS